MFWTHYEEKAAEVTQPVHLPDAIKSAFGSFADFKTQFNNAVLQDLAQVGRGLLNKMENLLSVRLQTR